QRNVGTLATEWYEELQIEPDTYKWSAHDRTAEGLSSKYLTLGPEDIEGYRPIKLRSICLHD
ncbi:hypothetical protein A2U01_0080503, partial [Trifolium medium]|nr:hypothetical protein [Trifolium medium]